MKNITKRLLATFLAISLLISAMPVESLAYMADKLGNLSFIDKEGNQVTPTADWETTFPYGTFAFENSSLTATEGGTESVIKVYRMGGTKGRAIAYLSYLPAVAELKPGVKSYATAAGKEDIVIRVEDPLPIAQYQPIGKDPAPQAPQVPVGITVTPAPEPEGDTTLTVDVRADSYQWYTNDGQWKVVSQATDATLPVAAADYDNYDFRCVYTVDGVTYSSNSAKGDVYEVPAEPALDPMPEGLERNPDPTYTTIPMDMEDPYAGYVFDLTFADGEWVKEIHISSPEDTVAEPDKFGMLTIISCEGGSLYDSANTLTVQIIDNEQAEASEIGFAVTQVTVDKSAGSAFLTVVRTGGTQTMLTLDFETKDGTARAGTDYSAAKGTLMFYADITEQTIEVPLINDGIETQDLLDFTVMLSNLKGDKDNLCTVTEAVATVSLFNTNTAAEQNLATLLHDKDAIDVSGSIETGAPVIETANTTITGTQVQDTTPPVVAQIVAEAGGDVSPLSYTYPTKLQFTRDNGYNGWKDRTFVTSALKGDADNYIGHSWVGGSPYEGFGWKVESRGDAQTTLSIDSMPKKYSSFDGTIFWKAALSSDGNLLIDGLNYVYPWFSIDNNIFRIDSGHKTGGGWWSGYTLNYNSQSKPSVNWKMSSDATGLKLGTSRYANKNAREDVYAALKEGYLTRRIMQNQLALRVHTANDKDGSNGNIATAPSGGAGLSSNNPAYNSIRPVVSIVPQEGGVNNSGQLYVGTKLVVSLQNTASYTPATEDSNLNTAVYLTNSSGVVVVTGQKDANSNTYFLPLLWNDMNEDSLSDSYTLNVVMTRKQNMQLDISPSVPRKTDAAGNMLSEIDSTKIDGAWNEFWNHSADSGNNKITYGYSAVTDTAPHFEYRQDGALTQDLFGATTSPIKNLNNVLENVQWVNFNRSVDDRILYNGRSYKGNETIWLDVADLAQASMIFRYYHKDFLSIPSVMSTILSQTALYWDGNGNGQIDGYYNSETGYFELDTSVTDDYGNVDELICFLNPNTDYDESIFAPVPIFDKNGSIIATRSYILKTYYTMTPRSLVPSPGADESARAQILPAFVSDVTNPTTKSQLTTEQQGYRYIISGKTTNTSGGTYTHSSDNHEMYGAVASKISTIDIPLGGDVQPPRLNSAKTGFDWTPKFVGNLLYPFAQPEPIIIPNSVAGSNIPVTEDYTITDSGLQVAPSGVTALNGYLGSFTGNDTFTLTSQEQKATTEEIIRANKPGALSTMTTAQLSLTVPKPESLTTSSSGAIPNSDYLKQMEPAADAPDTKMDMSQSGSSYPEFNLDMGTQLPSTDIAITDFVTIIMDEYEVGFSIGLPLGGYNSNGDAGTGGVGSGGSSGESNWVSPKKAYSAAGSDMGNLKNFLKSPSKKTAGEVDDSYGNANDGKIKSSGFEVEFSVSLAFLFKYNIYDNAYYFSQFSVAVSAGLEYTLKGRLTPCPILYLYLKINVAIELGTSATVEREVVHEETPVLSDAKVAKNKSTIFEVTTKAFDITFEGKMAMEVFTDAACTTPAPADRFAKSYIQSDGSEPVTIILDQAMSGNTLDKSYYVKLTAMSETTITELSRITKIRTKTYSGGFIISPEAFIEAGAGIGIEVVKIEVFIKINIACSMTLGKYVENDKGEGSYDAFEFDEFEFGLGLGFRVALLIFNYEMDLIRYTINFDGETNKWTHNWSALGGLYGGEIGELSAMDSQGNTYGVRVRLPGTAADTQRVYSGDLSQYGTIEPFAYKPTDAKVPFELSGYGSSGDAFKLADGMLAGYDYKVVTVGTTNYIVYTISRTDAVNPVDNTMLVLSRLNLTKTADGKDSYGLVNPTDPLDTNKPYIILDDDGTGDLSFSVWAEENVIYAAWESYASVSSAMPTVPTKPGGAPYTDGTTPMDETNYATYPEPAVPASVTEPTEPDIVEYYITSEEYDSLSPSDKGKYNISTDIIGTEIDFYHAIAYVSHTDAKAAYDAAVVDYTSNKALYDQYVVDLTDYNFKKSSYDAWKTYFAGSNGLNDYIQQQAATAAKNTVIKTAQYDTTATVGFTYAVTVSGATGSHVYLPRSANHGAITVYAKAEHYVPTDLLSETAAYDAYLSKAYPSDPTNPNDASASIRAYRALTQKGLWDAYGKSSKLCVYIGGTITETALASGQVLENLEVMEMDGKIFVAYTTGELIYQSDDLINTRRLYLRTVDPANSSAPWSDPILLRTAVDYDKVSSNDKDGLYSGTSLTTPYDDPYFANLQFLVGSLGAITGTEEAFNVTTLAAETPQPFLLFECNGSTYVIPKADLQGIVGADHKGRIIPFFTPAPVTNPDGSKTTPTTTGRAEVTIGADGAGNISAVYIGTVANSLNNGLFLSKWDPTSQTWGQGTMLATNYMGVHEDSTANQWSAADTEAAYLGKRKDYSKGGMDRFTFSNLQIALGQKVVTAPASLSLQGETVTQSSTPVQELAAAYGIDLGVSAMSAEDQEGLLHQLSPEQIDTLSRASTGDKDTLLVISQGSLQYLTDRKTGNKDESIIAPLSDAAAMQEYQAALNGTANGRSANRVPGTGFYALSYGVGGQAIGNATISFHNYDFTAGSALNTTFSFVNTGDVGIRGSTDNPITVTLSAGSAGALKTLGTWQVDRNIKAGENAQFSGSLASLTESLPTGTTFVISVSEDASYTTNPFSKSTTVFTVGEKPELGFEHFTADSTAMDADGNTVVAVEFQVGNRGNKLAEDVFVQFSYEQPDADGNSIYVPLDIRKNTLTVSKQSPLTTLTASNDLSNGIFSLNNAEDGNNIDKNNGRTVQGTITVPPAVYKGLITGSLNLKVDIFSKSSTITQEVAGLKVATHDEYNQSNNTAYRQIEHTTFVQAPKNITLPIGNTLRLPISLATTTGKPPVVSVSEKFDGNDVEKNLGILYYEGSETVVNGHQNGTVILAPSKTGTGIIHVEDLATNTIYPIAFTVTNAAEGINIFKDNDLFQFRNTNNTPYNPTASSQDWEFLDNISEWGSGTNAEAPYLGNLARGKVGASFTFRTVAKSITLYFNGSATVTVADDSSFAAKISATGGKTSATVLLGENPTNIPRNVTVKLTGGAGSSAVADFDRMVETYSSDLPPTPSDDATAPHIYWSRSFPDTASIETGKNPVTMTCYVFDDSGLSSLTLNGSKPDNLTKETANYWYFTTTVSENGPLTVNATDTSGNSTVRAHDVKWFNSTVSAGANAAAPTLSATFVDQNGAPLNGYISKGQSAFLSVSSTAPTHSAQVFIPTEVDGKISFVQSTLTQENNRYPVTGNGFYVVTATDANGKTATQVMLMNKMDNDIPALSLSLADASQLGQAQGAGLSWGVSKSNSTLSPITDVAINGHQLTIAPNQTRLSGLFPIVYGGDYVLTAKDFASNSSTLTLSVAGLPLQADLQQLLTLSGSWNQSKNNGAVELNPAAITGGTYLNTLSDADKAANRYTGRYDGLIVADTTSFDEQSLRKTLLEAFAKDYFDKNPTAKPDDPASIMPEDDLQQAVDAARQQVVTDWLEVQFTSPDADWTPLNNSTTVSDLAPGNYFVLLRDAQDPANTATTMAHPFTLSDEAITFTATTFRSTGFTVADGSMEIKAAGGRMNTGLYQFIARPMEKKDSPLVAIESLTDPLDPVKYPATTWSTPTWQMANLAAGDLSVGLLEGLRPGWYQIAVRTLEGVTAAQMQELVTAQTDLTAANNRVKAAAQALTSAELSAAALKRYNAIQEALRTWDNAADGDKGPAEAAYKTLIENDADVLTALETMRKVQSESTDIATIETATMAYQKAVTDLTQNQAKVAADGEKSAADAALPIAQAAYDAKEAALSAQATAAFAADQILWANAATGTAEVGYYSYSSSSSGSNIKPIITEDSVTLVFDNPAQQLSDSEQITLVLYNKTKDLIFKSKTMEARIPKGTLTHSDNIMNMLLPFAPLPTDATGYVVQYTDRDGKTHVVPMSLVTTGKVYYVAAHAGTYRMVKNDKTFPDVAADFWGADAISFVVARELFTGNEQGQFLPTNPMTRAMFVTVLGRLASINPADFSANRFSDVDAASWYGAFVAWAAQNNLVQGYDNGQFGPDDEITREQMCVILNKFLTYMGITMQQTGSALKFADQDAISGWAANAVDLFAQAGLLQGVGENRFAPGNQASRAEVAALYQRIITYILSK